MKNDYLEREVCDLEGKYILDIPSGTYTYIPVDILNTTFLIPATVPPHLSRSSAQIDSKNLHPSLQDKF